MWPKARFGAHLISALLVKAAYRQEMEPRTGVREHVVQKRIVMVMPWVPGAYCSGAVWVVWEWMGVLWDCLGMVTIGWLLLIAWKRIGPGEGVGMTLFGMVWDWRGSFGMVWDGWGIVRLSNCSQCHSLGTQPGNH